MCVLYAEEAYMTDKKIYTLDSTLTLAQTKASEEKAVAEALEVKDPDDADEVFQELLEHGGEA